MKSSPAHRLGDHVLHERDVPQDTVRQTESPPKQASGDSDSACDHVPPRMKPAPEPARRPGQTPGRSLRRAQMLIALAVMLAGDDMPPLFDDESERRYHAQLNKPKRKVSKRARRRAHATLASMSRMVDATRSMGPMVMRIIARDVSDLPFDRAELPAETMGIRWPMTPGIPIVCQPELRPGDVFAEYSDGSIRQIAGRREL